jgi:hypothetical protein
VARAAEGLEVLGIPRVAAVGEVVLVVDVLSDAPAPVAERLFV